jgi:ribosomal subunit interface protein
VDIVVRGRHLELSDRFRDHVTGKLSRIDRFGLPIEAIDVEVSYEPNPRQSDRAYQVEFTCRGKGPVIRAEAYAQDKYAAVDLALGRLAERLRRASDKRRQHRTARVVLNPAADLALASAPVVESADDEADDQLDPTTVWEDGPLVVRLKEHVASPMSVAQAVESMELVGHDFYLFRELDTGIPAVVYRRRGYTYGLIRLDGDGAA